MTVNDGAQQRRIVVELGYEATATVEVYADPTLSDAALRELALQELDKSGGAEWDTDDAWQHIDRNPDDTPQETA